MASIEEEILQDQEENARELAFIRARLPQAVKPHFTDDDLYYLMDAIVDYYYSSGILESTDEEVEIDMQEVANAITTQAQKDLGKTFDPEEVFYVVEADMDFQEESL